MPSAVSTQLVDVEPPAYNFNTRSQLTDHLFSLSKRGRQWLTLSLHSNARSHNVPLFTQGQEISGSVNLDLKKDVLLRSVSVSLSGELTTKMGVERFILLNEQLFEVGIASSPPLDLTWPFSFSLPKGVRVVLSDGKPKNFKLPPSLYNKASKGLVRYQVGVHVVTGTFGSEHKLYAPFEYVPLSRPSPRELSVNPSLSPGKETSGWKTLISSPIKGSLSDKRRAHLNCTVSLPQPLQYTRGFTIPVSFTVTSMDTNVLDIIPASSSPILRLDCHTSLDAMISLTALSSFDSWESPPEEVCRATWSERNVEEWNGQPKLVFNGELRVPEHIPPNCNIINFQLEYAISLYPTKFEGFTPAISLSRPILSERVEIATALAYVSHSLNAEPPEYI